MPRIYDEPFADSSQIPTLLLSRMTRGHVTVALSGDAGDELFCGYNRYGQGYKAHRILSRMPRPVLQVLAHALHSLPAASIDALVARLPRSLRYPGIGDKLAKLGTVLKHSEGRAFYRALISINQDPAGLVPGSHEPPTLLSSPEHWPALQDFREVMMYLDTLTYLPGDILTKVDRASMAVSLEARVPFLDHRVVEHAWRLPFDMKLRAGKTKWALRQVLNHYVPASLIERPKMGFGVPIGKWLSGPLRDWAEPLLDHNRLEAEGYLNAGKVRKMWEEHRSGRRSWHHQLWAILMFQAWLEKKGA